MIEDKIFSTIKKYNLINENDIVVCGVSGGPDSMCMLDNLRKIKESNKLSFEIVVCHLNHLIREEAILDEEYVINYCKKNNIKCYTKRIDVKQYANNKKQGTEEAGRNLRYDFFNEIFARENGNKIAIAHNKNDKVETMIMNMLRGSGINGLKGIEPIRENKYIRPIIELEREEIENYCMQNNLEPRIDKTNFVNDCTRNKIRNIVLPYLKKEFNPNIIQTFCRLSEVIEEDDLFLYKMVQKCYNEISLYEEKNKVILDLKKFNMQDDVIKKRLILYSINKIMGSVQNIEKVNIDDIVKLCENNIGNKFLMPNKNVKVFVNKGKLEFEKIEI